MEEKEEYIEIFELRRNGLQAWLDLGGEFARAAQAIQVMIETGRNVHFVDSAVSYEDNPPPVSLSTPIILGEAALEQCVRERALRLRVLGFSNVRIDPEICFSHLRFLQTLPRDRNLF